MTGAQAAGLPGREADSLAASAVKAMQAEGRHAEARERYAELVARHQRRAARIAFHYLRDSAESDEAVQDALVKAYSHLSSFREELPFEVWFTRILINGCLDRIKARTRRERWLVPMPESPHGQRDYTDRVASGGPSPEDQLLGRERRQKLATALARLPERQRSVFMLSHYEGCTSREVSAMTGLNESTVRVHLFRAIRRLRTLLAEDAASIGVGEKSAVPLLSRQKDSRHLNDGQFADIWSTATASGQPVADPHLAACAACRARFDTFTAWLDRIHDDAIGEAEEAFPPERLAMQQAQVMRRLEALERPARVIAFPRFSRPATATRGRAHHWGAAAAAGLVIGLAAGQMFDLRHLLTPRVQTVKQTARLERPVASTPSVLPASTSSVSDETLFFGGDPARTTERLSMLKSMDDITPRARDQERPR